MLRSPRRLPARYNRRVNDSTRRLVQRRHGRHRRYRVERFLRIARKVRQQSSRYSVVLLRMAPWVGLGALIVVVGVLLFSPFLEVREIRIIRSDRRVDVEHIQHTLAPLFGEHLLFLTQKQVLPLLEEAVPDLRKATIDKRYPSTLILRLELQPVVASLEIVDPAGNVSPAVTGTGSDALGDYLTAQGMYVVYPPSLVHSGTGTALVRVVDWGVRPEPWTEILDVALLERMAQAEQQLRSQFGASIEQRVVYLRSREFHIQTERHSLWFDMRGTLMEHLDRYRLFVQSAGADAAGLYVDLRLKDRIVYK